MRYGNSESPPGWAERARVENVLSQGQRYHSVYRVSLGEHDNDAEEGHSVMACYGNKCINTFFLTTSINGP